MIAKLSRALITLSTLSWIFFAEVECFAPLLSPVRATSSICLSMSLNKLCGNPPYLAVLTEPDACTSTQRMDETVHAIERATADGGVTLVIVRINDDDDVETSDNKWNLMKRLSELKQQRLAEGNHSFLLVVNNDVELVLRALSCNMHVDGVHVKEYNAHLIPDVRQQLNDALQKTVVSTSNDAKQQQNIIIGTSCHSIQSALDSYNLIPRGPDYLFVGTCYLTQSHPEKTSLDQLEGPTLPGRVREVLYKSFREDDSSGNVDSELSGAAKTPPIIFAIGGIDEHNCNEPVKYGADGVATIRTVMKAEDPREIVKQMNEAMLK